jgi:hypothetical protein
MRIRIQLPVGLASYPLPAGKRTGCSVQLRPKDFADRTAEYDVDVYTLELSAPGSGTFLDAANSSGFDFYKGQWVTRGRHGARDEATVINDERWSGLKGVALVGCHHEHDGYAGLCELARLVLQDERENIWTMEGGPQTEEVFEMIFSSFLGSCGETRPANLAFNRTLSGGVLWRRRRRRLT